MTLSRRIRARKRGCLLMVIKIFKISTKEMWTLQNKDGLCEFIKQETGQELDNRMTIIQLMRYLPKQNYHRVK